MKISRERSMATLVASCRVRPGQFDTFYHWYRTLKQGASSDDSFVAAELHETLEGDEDKWVATFRFETVESLRQWTVASGLTGALSDGVFAEPPVFQTVCGGQERDHQASLVFSHRIKPGCEDQFRKWHKRMAAIQCTFPGVEAVEDLRPVPGVQDDWVTIVKFSDEDRAAAWMNSGKRQAIADELPAILDTLHVNRVQSGFDFWFNQPGESAPPAWKQALAVLFCLQPSVVVISLYLGPFFGPFNFVNQNLAENIICVLFMTWAGMPLTDRVLGFFLKPSGSELRANVLGVLFITAFLAACSLIWRNAHL